MTLTKAQELFNKAKQVNEAEQKAQEEFRVSVEVPRQLAKILEECESASRIGNDNVHLIRIHPENEKKLKEMGFYVYNSFDRYAYTDVYFCKPSLWVRILYGIRYIIC